MSGAGDALPPASFDVLVQVFATPCALHLGLVADPTTGRVATDLPQARWVLDLLHVLREKTEASLSHDERERLDAVLHQLRSAYNAAKTR